MKTRVRKESDMMFCTVQKLGRRRVTILCTIQKHTLMKGSDMMFCTVQKLVMKKDSDVMFCTEQKLHEAFS